MKKILISVILLLNCIAAMAQSAGGNTTVNESRWLLSADVNFAYRLGKTPDGLSAAAKDYNDDLKSGISYSLGLYYKFHKYMGVGLKFNSFSSEASISNTYAFSPNGQEGYTTISDDINIFFVGPAFIFDRKFGIGHFTAETALGYMEYRNNMYILGNYKYTGETMGATLGASYKFEVLKGLSVGPQITLVTGSVTEFDVKGPNGYSVTFDKDNDEAESLWHFDAGISATYRF